MMLCGAEIIVDSLCNIDFTVYVVQHRKVALKLWRLASGTYTGVSGPLSLVPKLPVNSLRNIHCPVYLVQQ